MRIPSNSLRRKQISCRAVLNTVLHSRGSEGMLPQEIVQVLSVVRCIVRQKNEKRREEYRASWGEDLWVALYHPELLEVQTITWGLHWAHACIAWTGCVIVCIIKKPFRPSQHLAVSSWSHKPGPTNPNVDHSQSGPPRGLGRPRANTKSGPPKNGSCKGGLGAHPRKFLHALKCVLGAPEALFRACIQHIYTCKLPSSISGFSSKSTMYGALASVSSIKQNSRLNSVGKTVKPTP